MYTKIRKAIFYLLFFFISSLGILSADQAEILQTDEMTVVFEKPLEPVAEELAIVYPRIKAELERTLDWHVDFRPTLILVNNRERFIDMAGSSLVAAYAVPRRRLIVLDYSRLNTDPFSLGVILKHELCHLLLHHHIKSDNLPKWLDEGVSQLVSDGVSEIIMKRQKSVLPAAVLSKSYLGINRLHDSFPQNQKSLLLAYEESKSLVDYISKEYGRDRILDVLRHLRDGHDVNAAVLKSLSISIGELESNWHAHLRKSITWFTYLANNLYGILFFLAALITVAGFVRLLIKKRRYQDEDERHWS